MPLPWTSIKAGSLVSCEGGECVVPTQVILDSLLSGVPSTLNGLVRSWDPNVRVFAESLNTAILRSLTDVPFTNQFIKVATAVQFNRTLWLSVIFTDCGGTTIPTGNDDSGQLSWTVELVQIILLLCSRASCVRDVTKQWNTITITWINDTCCSMLLSAFIEII